MLPPVAHPPASAAELARAFVGVPLGLLFAEPEHMSAIAPDYHGTLEVEEPAALTDANAFLILPSDIGTEIIDILEDGDRELLGEAMRDGLLALGSLGPGDPDEETMRFEMEAAISPRDALALEPDYAETVPVGGGGDPLPAINGLPLLQLTMLSSLVDDESLEKILRRREFAGTSWRAPPNLREQLDAVSPTYLWSRRQLDGSVGIEFALFVEEEELIALLRPVRLTPP